MSESVHGREIVALLAAQPEGLKEADLLSLIEQQFPNGLFHTCKVKDMNKAQILASMISKGRIIEQDGILVSKVGCGCKQ
ncbi:DUF2492 family protein [Moritella sp. 24]|uniref:DUF2492 family protein n=1 Tax=Moritella sp. 24 TaxID=2746230 RepID=UPI001BA5F19E|nr:DUF2492 family protein [Moritella sp. 24]QUM76566.1 DUF2492 family protein [Moritella sp. 24]